MLKERLSNFELLRIVAISLILLSHSGLTISTPTVSSQITQSGLASASSPSIFTVIFGFVANMGGSIGNSIFIILAGYFSAGKASDPKRCIKIITPVFFYTICYFLIGLLFNTGTVFNVHNWTLIDVFHYFVTGGLWFIFSYSITLVLTYPIMTRWSVIKNSHKILLFLFSLLFIFSPTFPLWELFYFIPALKMLPIFFLGAILRDKIDILRKFKIWTILAIILVFSIFVLGFYYYSKFIVNDEWTKYLFINRVLGQILIPLLVIPFFTLIDRLEFQNNLINTISKNCLAIYMFHQVDYSVTGVFLFNRTSAFNSQNLNIFASLGNSNILIGVCYQVFAIILVFIIAVIIGEVRSRVAKTISNSVKNKLGFLQK